MCVPWACGRLEVRMPKYHSEYDSFHHLREKAIISRSDLLDQCLSELATIGVDVEKSIINVGMIFKRIKEEKKQRNKLRRNMQNKQKRLNYREAGENEGSCFKCKNSDISDGGSCKEFPAQEYPLFVTTGTNVCDAFGVKETENVSPKDMMSMMIESHLEQEREQELPLFVAA